MISCPDFFCVVVTLYLRPPPRTTSSLRLHARVSNCLGPTFMFGLPLPLRCPFLEFMVTVVASASVFYEAAGGLGCQAFLAVCLTAPFLQAALMDLRLKAHVCLRELAARHLGSIKFPPTTKSILDECIWRV